MRAFSHSHVASPPVEAALPAVVLSRYLFFLTQRPVSRSNAHYVRQRIEGLQSLGALLTTDAHELLASVRLLRTLDPANLREVSERLQQTLFPFTRAEVPPTYISADAPPPPELLRTSERVLMILGPAIGIGDEIVTFPLPQWIKRASPGAHVTTLTTYEGLWDDVAAVDRVATYRDHHALVRALRGEHEVGAADLVLLVDFERPDLFRAVTGEPGIARYAELSLGARVLSVVDNRERWTYHQALPFAYLRNVYDGFDALAGALGVAPSADDRVARAPGERGNGALRVLVSPFSSKYDPSPRYWSALVASLVPEGAARPVEVRLDPGPNATTRQFARDVARAARSRAHRSPVSVTVAGADAPGPLSLAGALAELERADVVVCADSFAAHAAPRLGCTTLVLASPGLENWRVPNCRSYYFEADAPLESVVAGMRHLLELHGVRPAHATRPPIEDAEHDLRRADAELERALADHAGLGDLCDAYERFRAARAVVTARVAGWPPEAAALTGDHAYDHHERGLNGDGAIPSGLERDASSFVRDHWLTWRNTNLRKYLDARVRETGV